MLHSPNMLIWILHQVPGSPCVISASMPSSQSSTYSVYQNQRGMPGSNLLAYKYRIWCKRMNMFLDGEQHRGSIQCKMLWRMMPTNVHSACRIRLLKTVWKLCCVKEFKFMAFHFCIPTKHLLVFQQRKWDPLYSVWCDSIALLTHPETCWMQPPLFAVLPSSTAPSTVAKQPT